MIFFKVISLTELWSDRQILDFACDRTQSVFLSESEFAQFPGLYTVFRNTVPHLQEWFSQYSEAEHRHILLSIIRSRVVDLRQSGGAVERLVVKDWQELFARSDVQRICKVICAAKRGPNVPLISLVRSAENIEALPEQKKQAYLVFLESLQATNKLTFGHWETYLFSKTFYGLLTEIPDRLLPDFFSNAFLANYYFEWSENSIVSSQLSDSELSSFEFVRQNIAELRGFRTSFLSQQTDVYQRLRQTGVYEPVKGQEFEVALSDLATHIVSDNLSFWRHLNYVELPSGIPNWFRAFDGVPAYLLHGTSRNFWDILDSKMLKPGGGKSYDATTANRCKGKLFFGSPTSWHSRTGRNLEIGPNRIYGDYVIEFPIHALPRTLHPTFPMRGLVFKSFRTVHDPSNQAVFDIVSEQDSLPLNRASLIYVASEQQKTELVARLQQMPDLAHLQVLTHDEFYQRQHQLEVYATTRLHDFFIDHPDLVVQMTAIQKELTLKIQQEVSRRQGNNVSLMDHALIEGFVEVLCGLTFDDFRPDARF